MAEGGDEPGSTAEGHVHSLGWGRGSGRAQNSEQRQHSLMFTLIRDSGNQYDRSIPLPAPLNMRSGLRGPGSGERPKTESSAWVLTCFFRS